MDLRKLKKLIDLVQESGISELEVTEGEEKVRIVKNFAASATPAPAPAACCTASASRRRPTSVRWPASVAAGGCASTSPAR